MQYLLTEDERKALVRRDELTKAEAALDAARQHLLKLAAFTCIHDQPDRRGYCSDCPCSPLRHDDYQTWQLVCRRPKIYSQ